MALITLEDLRLEVEEKTPANDELLRAMASGIESLWETLTNRTLESTAHTEYHNIQEYGDTIFLKNWPVVSDPAVQLWEDPDWEWGSDTLIAATDYRVDYVNGVIYYNSYFLEGKQTVKVSYTAGYSVSTLPDGWKRILVRQGVHWFHQAKHSKWDVASVAEPAGAGTTSYKNLVSNLLPDFALLVEKERMKW